jgi:hypothetical protein
VLLLHLVHLALLDEEEHKVVEPAREARDEEGLPVAEGAPGEELAGEADGGDEEEVVEVVGGGEVAERHHVVEVHRVHDGQRPPRRRAEEGGVVVDLGGEGCRQKGERDGCTLTRVSAEVDRWIDRSMDRWINPRMVDHLKRPTNAR